MLVPLRPSASRGQPPRRHTRQFAVFLIVCTAPGLACGGERDEAPSGLLRQLAREMEAAPAVEPRLSIASAPRPCTREGAPVASAFGGRCAAVPAAAPSSRITDIGARAAQRIRGGTDAEALHAAALIDLLYGGGEGKSLQQSISSLQTAARLSERPAPVLADLAAAHLIRAGHGGTPRDLVAAVETAEEALEREPRHPAALYNLAMALEQLGLAEEAAAAWRGYAAADPGSGWVREAERHLARVLATPAEPPPPPAGAPLTAYADFAAAEPQRTREVGWCRVLGDWAAAELAGDAAGAEGHLQRAETLGAALERRPGGDATLADAARIIRAGRGGSGMERLARAHREFTAGCAFDKRVDFPAAASRFGQAAALATASPPLRAWSRAMFGGMSFRAGDMKTGEAALREVVTTVDPARHAGLATASHLALAALLLRSDRHDAGMQQARLAADRAARAGEGENEGVALATMSIASFSTRDMDRGYAQAHQALARLRRYRGSFRLHNLLASAGQTVADDGFPRTAVRMLNEGVRVAQRTGTPVFMAEAHLIRARLLAQAGARARAAGDVAAGRQAVDRLTVRGSRAWMTAQLQAASAAAILRERPADAAASLDSAATFFMGIHAPLVALPAVVGAAQARLAAGDAALGTARLETALSILEQRRESIRMEPRRAAVFNAAQAVVDRVTMLELASHGAAAGLAYLDRGRASLAAAGRTVARDSMEPAVGPRGEVALVYALVGDTLLVWTVAETRVDLYRQRVNTLQLARSIDQVRWQLEAGDDEAEIHRSLARLYDALVRPVERRLGPPSTPLVVVADGEIASIPFAALYDAGQKKYLVETRAVRFAASLREAGRREPRRPGPAPPLFVADPAFDATRHPAFARLREAVNEVESVAADYPGRRMLTGRQATPTAFRESLAGAGLMHYAGHAVFDDERPERSYLLLATPGGNGRETLEAGEIAQMDLRNLSLVVLAACQTVRNGHGRAAGFSGLAGAFLAAGAGGAVGSLWEVDDRFTRRLMVEFHQAYRGSGNARDALRSAQLTLLKSNDPTLRSPAAWAGFRYAGR